jgi:hypothetical protein
MVETTKKDGTLVAHKGIDCKITIENTDTAFFWKLKRNSSQLWY